MRDLASRIEFHLSEGGRGKLDGGKFSKKIPQRTVRSRTSIAEDVQDRERNHILHHNPEEKRIDNKVANVRRGKKIKKGWGMEKALKGQEDSEKEEKSRLSDRQLKERAP